MKEKLQSPPNSKESEMMVLGCMLTSINNLNIGADSLEASDFYFAEHQIIFDSLKRAYQNDKPADVHLIAEELKSRNKLQSVGGVSYLTTLGQYAGTSAYIEEYVQLLKEKALLRRIIETTQKIEQEALKDPSDALKFLYNFQEELKQIEKSSSSKQKIGIRFLNQFENNFLLKEPPKKPMLLEYAPPGQSVKGFLAKGIVAMLVGAGGIGKTHLLAQLAIAAASGTPFLEVFRTTEHCGKNGKGTVFIGLGENQYDDIHRLIFKASKKIRSKHQDLLEENHLKEASKRIAVFSFCGQQAAFIENRKPSRYFREFKMRLTESAPVTGWSLLILDPISRLLGADAEIDNAAATQFIALMEELTIDLPGNPTVLFAHHVNKAALAKPEEQNQASARGASGLTDGVRLQINFFCPNKENPEIAILKMTKSNFTAIAQDIHTRKDSSGFIEYSQDESSKPIKEHKPTPKGPPNFAALACKDTE